MRQSLRPTVQVRARFLFAFVILLISSAPASAASLPLEKAKPVNELLRPDGSLALDSGYTGPLDLSGFRMETGANGEPRFIAEQDESSASSPRSHSDDPDDHWSGEFSGPAGPSHRVESLAVMGGDLYAGGQMKAADGLAVSSLAKWNGQKWSALGEGVRSAARNERVLALAVMGDELIVGGKFETAGGAAANGIASWNGQTWSALGSGMTAGSNVYALTVVGTDLYAGGDFATAGGVAVGGIAKWNGSAWSALGSGTNPGGVVRALMSIGGDLFAGGTFTSMDGGSASRVARWNGSAWSALGAGTGGGNVYALAELDGELYAGGDFTSAGAQPANRIARWNGVEWSALGTGIDAVSVRSLGVLDGDLIVGGRFFNAGGSPANCIARWDGAAWSTFGVGMGAAFGDARAVDAITVDSGNLYLGGDFVTADGVNAFNAAKWNGSAWSGLGTAGYGGYGGALAVHGTDLYVGGGGVVPYTSKDGVTLRGVGVWNGSSWAPLSDDAYKNSIYTMESVGDDLYIAGALSEVGDTDVSQVARWNGSTWSDFGSTNFYPVRVLLFDGTDVYASGDHQTVGATQAAIWKREGDTWTGIGRARPTGLIPFVHAMAMFDGELWVGGQFTNMFTDVSDVPANRIAKWNGTSWSAIGTGADGVIESFHVTDSNLYVGGAFSNIDGTPASRIAKWNGSTWSALGAGLTGQRVYDMIGTDTELYVVGQFTHAGGMPAGNIAKWNGSAWSNVGSALGLQNYAGFQAGSVSYIARVGDDLYVSGNFGFAGYKESKGIARYRLNVTGGVCGDSIVDDGEDCDDGDTEWTAGEACNEICLALECGDPNDSGTITTGDAQFALRTSVGTATCSTAVCDANGNGTVTTTDALLILRRAVGQSVSLICS